MDFTTIAQITCFGSTVATGYGIVSRNFNIISGGLGGIAIFVMMFTSLNQVDNDISTLPINTNTTTKTAVLINN